MSLLSNLTLAALLASATVHSQDMKPSPSGAPVNPPASAQASMPLTNELFAEERADAQRQHTEWVQKDDNADAADGASYTDRRKRHIEARQQKKVELDAWAVYYQRVATHWQSVYQAIVNGSAGRGATRQDIVNILATEKKEYEEVLRRRTDLVRSLNDKGVDISTQPAISELSKLLEMKKANIETAERALKEADQAAKYDDKRRDLARTRAFYATQMIRSVEVERPLWEAVYGGRLSQTDLRNEKDIPDPEQRPGWKTQLDKNTSGGEK